MARPGITHEKRETKNEKPETFVQAKAHWVNRDTIAWFGLARALLALDVHDVKFAFGIFPNPQKERCTSRVVPRAVGY